MMPGGKKDRRRDTASPANRTGPGSVLAEGIDIVSPAGPAEAARRQLVRFGVCNVSLASAERFPAQGPRRRARQEPPQPQVVIIGAGFAGLAAAQALRRAPVRITIIDHSNHHLFQPLLYQVATAALSPADIATP